MSTLVEKLKPELVQVHVEANNKTEILHQIAHLAAEHNELARCSEEDIYQALLRREEMDSTGFGGGIAIPHCTLPMADDFVVGIFTVEQGIDFAALDDEPVSLFAFILGPDDRRNEHIKLLASVSRILENPVAVKELQTASNAETLQESLLRHDNPDIPENELEQCMVQAFVQREELFQPVLKVISESTDGAVSVMEANNAGAYLNRIPLFSGFWNESSHGFCRVILAIVPKQRTEEMVRHLEIELGELKNVQGMMVTIQTLNFWGGQLDF